MSWHMSAVFQKASVFPGAICTMCQLFRCVHVIQYIKVFKISYFHLEFEN